MMKLPHIIICNSNKEISECESVYKYIVTDGCMFGIKPLDKKNEFKTKQTKTNTLQPGTSSSGDLKQEAEEGRGRQARRNTSPQPLQTTTTTTTTTAKYFSAIDGNAPGCDRRPRLKEDRDRKNME